MRSGSRCPAFYGEIPPMRWGILNDDGGYFYCIPYTSRSFEVGAAMTLPPNKETVISPMHTACRIDFFTIMLFVLSLRMSIMDIAIITY